MALPTGDITAAIKSLEDITERARDEYMELDQIPSDLAASLAALWEACQEYCVMFEVFSHN